MEFVLRYRGALPAKPSNTVVAKHKVRLYLHPQLQELCRRERVWQPASANGLPIAKIKGRRLHVTSLNSGVFFRVPFRGIDFIPLVSRPHELACQVDILWLRREKPGEIVGDGGDLDNRLKTLFDGLRMPYSDSDVPEGAAIPEGRCYCLLEDDALITKISITTYQLLEPLPLSPPEIEGNQPGHPGQDVDLILRILVQSTSQQGGVEGFNYA